MKNIFPSNEELEKLFNESPHEQFNSGSIILPLSEVEWSDCFSDEENNLNEIEE